MFIPSSSQETVFASGAESSPTHSPHNVSLDCMRRVEKLFQQQKFTLTITFVNECLEARTVFTDNQLVLLHGYRIDAFHSMGQLEDSLLALQDFLSMDNLHADLRATLYEKQAQALYHLKRFEDAYNAVKKGLNVPNLNNPVIQNRLERLKQEVLLPAVIEKLRHVELNSFPQLPKKRKAAAPPQTSKLPTKYPR